MDCGCEFFLCWVGIVSRLTFIYRSLVSGATRFVARCVCVILAKYQLIAKGNWNWMNWMKFTLLRCFTLPCSLIACYCVYLSVYRRSSSRASAVHQTVFGLRHIIRFGPPLPIFVSRSVLRSFPLNYKCVLPDSRGLRGSRQRGAGTTCRRSTLPRPLSFSLALSMSVSLASVSILSINKENKKRAKDTKTQIHV